VAVKMKGSKFPTDITVPLLAAVEGVVCIRVKVYHLVCWLNDALSTAAVV
jgi:hypothetical protein